MPSHCFVRVLSKFSTLTASFLVYLFRLKGNKKMQKAFQRKRGKKGTKISCLQKISSLNMGGRLVSNKFNIQQRKKMQAFWFCWYFIRTTFVLLFVHLICTLPNCTVTKESSLKEITRIIPEGYRIAEEIICSSACSLLT